MAAQLHSYGPNCLLYEPSEQKPTNTNVISATPPKIRAQYFYISPLPIDDPLTAVPTPTGPPDLSKLPPRPFSVHDNIALEKAWKELRKAIDEEHDRHEHAGAGRLTSLQRLAVRGKTKETRRLSQTLEGRKAREALAKASPKPIKRENAEGSSNSDKYTDRTVSTQESSDIFYSYKPFAREGSFPATSESSDSRKRHSPPLDRISKSRRRNQNSSPGCEEDISEEESGQSSPIVRHSDETNISGSPFIRAPIRDRENRRPAPLSRHSKDGIDTGLLDGSGALSSGAGGHKVDASGQVGDAEYGDPEITVTVGASRLHLIEFPNLQVRLLFIVLLNAHPLINDR